jgi:hypothetical protein
MIAMRSVVVVVAAAVVFLVTRPEEPGAATRRRRCWPPRRRRRPRQVHQVAWALPAEAGTGRIGAEDSLEMPASQPTRPSRRPPTHAPARGDITRALPRWTPDPLAEQRIVWYAPDAPRPGHQIQDFYADPEVGSRVIVAPYDYPDQGEAGTLPEGTQMALVSWHHVQTCAEANLGAAFGFTARYGFPTFEGQDWLGARRSPARRSSRVHEIEHAPVGVQVTTPCSNDARTLPLFSLRTSVVGNPSRPPGPRLSL